MTARVSRVSVCLIAMACIVGCGGSSSGGSSGGGGGTPTTVTYTFTGAAPSAIATQIGTGAYTQATLQSGKLSLSIPSGTTNYALAFVCPPIDSEVSENIELIMERSTLDGTSYSESCFPPASTAPGAVTLQVNASAIPGAEFVTVASQLDQTLPSNGIANFSGQLESGTYDLFVAAYDINSSLLAVRVLRSQTIPGSLNGGNPVVFTASDAPVTQAITYSNLPAGFSNEDAFVNFFTSGGASLTLTNFQKPLPPTQYLAMPPAALQSGDYYILETGAELFSNNGNNLQVVNTDQAFSAAGPQTITYPAPWTYSGPSAAALPTFNFGYSGFAGMPSVVEYGQIAWFVQTTISSDFDIEISATQNYQGGNTSLTLPDLSKLTGFYAPPSSGTSVSWDAAIAQGSPSSTTPPSGTQQVVSNQGSFIEP